MFRKGRFSARLARTAEEVAAAQRLRHRAFIGGTGARMRPGHRDADAFDGACAHVLVEDIRSGALACCFRLMLLRDGGEIGRSYAAQFYDLEALAAFGGRMVEMGRFCIAPAYTRDPDLLRIAWGAMTRFVDEAGVEMLFGCTSFRGTDTAAYAAAFALLADRHLAPARWRPGVRAEAVVPFAAQGRTDAVRAWREMPPLLRSYLSMGGWVSDHAVVDADLNTLHVFTGLEIAAVPPARARALRTVAE